jgi:hypothetical protein
MFTSIKVWDAGVAAKAHPSTAGRHGQPNLSHSEPYLRNNEYMQAVVFGKVFTMRQAVEICLTLGMPTS